MILRRLNLILSCDLVTNKYVVEIFIGIKHVNVAFEGQI